MSYSSLWIIDKNWSGREFKCFKNSWLFAPIVWDIMMCKYVPKSERKLTYMRNFEGKIQEYETSYLCWTSNWAQQGKERRNILNDRINNSTEQFDRVLWELSNLSVFNAKDKDFVADCIEQFVKTNFIYLDFTDNEHIKERFLEVAKDIIGLPKRCKYFVFKGSSCDDNVEYWFYRKRLSSWKKFICEFTLIESNKVVGFADNLEVCKIGAE